MIGRPRPAVSFAREGTKYYFTIYPEHPTGRPLNLSRYAPRRGLPSFIPVLARRAEKMAYSFVQWKEGRRPLTNFA
jgi:hypothetical protein